MKKLLPIGSVVMLKDGNKRVMICGRVQTKIDDGIIYDYSACYFPEGIISPNELFLFNNDDIKLLYFMGLQDVEEFNYRQYLNKELSKEGDVE